MTEFRRKRFILACFFALTTTAGWWVDKMSGGEYALVIGTILSLYSADVIREMFKKDDF